MPLGAHFTLLILEKWRKCRFSYRPQEKYLIDLQLVRSWLIFILEIESKTWNWSGIFSPQTLNTNSNSKTFCFVLFQVFFPIYILCDCLPFLSFNLPTFDLSLCTCHILHFKNNSLVFTKYPGSMQLVSHQGLPTTKGVPLRRCLQRKHLLWQMNKTIYFSVTRKY